MFVSYCTGCNEPLAFSDKPAHDTYVCTPCHAGKNVPTSEAHTVHEIDDSKVPEFAEFASTRDEIVRAARGVHEARSAGLAPAHPHHAAARDRHTKAHAAHDEVGKKIHALLRGSLHPHPGK